MKLKWNQDRAEWAFRENCFFSSSFSNSSTWKVREWKERKAKFETHAEKNKHTNAHTSITVMSVHKIGKWETKRQIKEEKICNPNGMRYHGTWSKLRQWYKNICFLSFFLVWVQTKCYPLQWNSFCNFSFLLLEYCFSLYFFIFVLFYFFYCLLSVLQYLCWHTLNHEIVIYLRQNRWSRLFVNLFCERTYPFHTGAWNLAAKKSGRTDVWSLARKKAVPIIRT